MNFVAKPLEKPVDAAEAQRVGDRRNGKQTATKKLPVGYRRHQRGRGFERLSALVNARCLSKEAQRRI